MVEEQTESVFEGFFAQMYDTMNSDASDIPFYLEIAEKSGDSVLDVGSGTGRLMVPLLKKRIDIIGVEPSSDMITICKDKFRENRVHGTIIQSTAQEFSTYRKFSLIFVTSDTFRQFSTTRDQLKSLVNIREHLEEQGKLIIDLSIPDLEHMVKSNGKEQVSDFKNPESGSVVKKTLIAEYDYIGQTESDTVTLSEIAGKKSVRKATASARTAFFFPRELILLLSSCGYSVRDIWKDYRMNPFDSTAQSIIVEAMPIAQG